MDPHYFDTINTLLFIKWMQWQLVNRSNFMDFKINGEPIFDWIHFWIEHTSADCHLIIETEVRWLGASIEWHSIEVGGSDIRTKTQTHTLIFQQISRWMRIEIHITLTIILGWLVNGECCTRKNRYFNEKSSIHQSTLVIILILNAVANALYTKWFHYTEFQMSESLTPFYYAIVANSWMRKRSLLILWTAIVSFDMANSSIAYTTNFETCNIHTTPG